ncbi:MAG TPA: hypothetical protein VNB23_10250 [Ramlibacter sp.]|nr:hypothetical protein [Ramlibacter sp.]
MNRIIASTLIAASAAFAGHALADDITPSDTFVSSADRAQVQAGVAQARTAANPWSIAYNPLAAFQGNRTRAEVRAEYIASRDDVAARTGEDSGAFALAREPQRNVDVAGGPADVVVE